MSEHQPCNQQALSFRCPFPEKGKKKCCWVCDKGYCHMFYVFGHACKEAGVNYTDSPMVIEIRKMIDEVIGAMS